MSSKISPTFCLKKVSRTQCRERETTQEEFREIHKVDGAENLKRPKQPEFSEQNPEERELYRERTPRFTGDSPRLFS